MDKGGYQIIDLHGYEFNAEEIAHQMNISRVIVDIIFRCREGLEKPVLISGLNINGVEYPDMYGVITHFEKYSDPSGLNIKLPVKWSIDDMTNLDTLYFEPDNNAPYLLTCTVAITEL